MQEVQRVEHQPGTPPPPIELSDATLNNLISALDGAGDGPSGRRGNSRLRVQGTAVMIPLDPSSGSAARDVGVYDISRSGIAIVHTQQMAPGERFKLHVPRPGGEPVEMICTVRHCRPLEGQFVIGAQFGGDFSKPTRPDGVSPIAAALRAKGATPVA